ncbi:TetR/AcrR family transcriptional regulator [Companilactobacillus futsaii]|uniref:TetR/AcrR family transcriptional regulator n=2 Tax=Companilactobacillus futsaii TaxID=938155 RepID=A0A5B7T2I5_9LACO|nr:TetR-like C-terminal domain-containing protein [Companilactobacillus futsaii]KRK90930.1 transcriptional regulator [Companilactobacillus futsaii JCM 17355]QCX24341.1 TetR/AcrR family transcriptional regulator [Companilactobacillus futsaii]
MNQDLKIQTAFVELLERKPIEEITIFEIADKCQIAHKTIFEKYSDKYQILQAIEDDIFVQIGTTKKDVYHVDTHEFAGDDRILQILNSVYENKKVITLLLGEGGDPRFHERFITYLVQKGFRVIENSGKFNDLDQRQKELLLQYVLSALVGLVTYWVKHPEMTVQELHTFFEKLFFNGITSLTAK